MKPVFISVKQFRQIAGIGKTTAHKLIKENAVQSVKVGGRRLVLRKSVQDLGSDSIKGEA